MNQEEHIAFDRKLIRAEMGTFNEEQLRQFDELYRTNPELFATTMLLMATLTASMEKRPDDISDQDWGRRTMYLLSQIIEAYKYGKGRFEDGRFEISNDGAPE